MSQFFTVVWATALGKEVSFLSLRLFIRCICDLLIEIVNSGVGCNLSGVMVNILADADDTMLSLLFGEIARLILRQFTSCEKDVAANPRESLCMYVFVPERKEKNWA
jgi:hypothetical protein